MPSVSHELLVELFRAAPELAGELLRLGLGVPLPEGTASLASADLSQVTPPTYAADVVVEIASGAGKVEAAVIVEIQLGLDADKRRSWPVYLAVLRARLGCPVFLLVVTPSEDVARWAREPIALGHPGFQLQPLVAGPEAVLRLVDPAVARRAPELAVLSALTWRDAEVARTAVAALALLAEERSRLYFDAVWAALPQAVRAALEEWMDKHEYQSEFARKYLAQGRAEGEAKGRKEGREEGREEGRLRLCKACLALLQVKLGSVPPDVARRVEAMRDLATLETLLVDLGTAQDVEAVRAALASHLG